MQGGITWQDQLNVDKLIFSKDTYFVPLGKQKGKIEEVVLKIEELDAMRLELTNHRRGK